MTANAGNVGRRTAVIAASSGLVVSMGVTAADASPASSRPAEIAPPTARSAQQLPVQPVALSVPVDVQNARVGAVAAAVIAPPPPPPPPPPVVEVEVEVAEPLARATARASRSAARTAPAPVVPEPAAQAAPAAVEPAPAEAAPAEAAPAPQGDLSATRANIMAVAARYVGTPYRYGGTTPSGFDCSGFMAYVFAQVGITLPRTSGSQAASAVKIPQSQALPGDLVYKPGHIGIYAGDGMLYDSPRTGSIVSKRAIWSSDFGFFRVLNG